LLREYLQWMYPFRPGMPHLHATGAGVRSSITDLYVFRKEKDGICPTLACRVDTLLKSVGEGLLAGHEGYDE
jgi:hypothetical protein